MIIQAKNPSSLSNHNRLKYYDLQQLIRTYMTALCHDNS